MNKKRLYLQIPHTILYCYREVLPRAKFFFGVIPAPVFIGKIWYIPLVGLWSMIVWIWDVQGITQLKATFEGRSLEIDFTF